MVGGPLSLRGICRGCTSNTGKRYMRLKTLFFLLMGGFATLTIIAALSAINVQYGQYRAARDARSALSTLEANLGIIEHIAIERGGHNEALLADGIPTPAIRD